MAALKKFGAAFEALRECACAVERGDLSRADLSMKRVLDLAEDDYESRIVRYFAQALARRAYRLRPKYPPDFSNCYLDHSVLYPYTAAKLIQHDSIEKAASSGKSKLHLIFFSLNCFDKATYCYMKGLRRLKKVPQMCLKITLVDTSNSGYSTTGFDSKFDYLRRKAKGIKFEINRVGVINNSLDELDVSRLKIDRDDEFVVVSCSFLLGYMLPAALNKFLVMLRDGINPDIFILKEYDVNLNQSEFLLRFDESLQHYSYLYSFIDRNRLHSRFTIQRLRDEISYIVACEGGARVVRHMTSDQWRDLLNKYGFSSIPILYDNEGRINDYNFDFKIENGCVKLNEKGQERPFFFYSAWEIKESSFDEDFYHNSSDGDLNFHNLPISPDPEQHRSLIRMASLTEVLEMNYQKLKDYKDEYHMRAILTWEKCEANHNPCLCNVEQVGFISKVLKYHLQERNHVSEAFEGSRPCFEPHITDARKDLPYLFGLDRFVFDWFNGAFAIKLNSVYANCEGYVVEVLFTFPYGMVDEERQRVMEKILWDLRNEKSSFVTCSTPHDFLDKLEATPDVVRIIDNQSHNNVMDMNVPLLHQSSTPNAMPASHQNELLYFAELFNLNEVSSTPNAMPTSHQKDLLNSSTRDIDLNDELSFDNWRLSNLAVGDDMDVQVSPWPPHQLDKEQEALKNVSFTPLEASQHPSKPNASEGQRDCVTVGLDNAQTSQNVISRAVAGKGKTVFQEKIPSDEGKLFSTRQFQGGMSFTTCGRTGNDSSLSPGKATRDEMLKALNFTYEADGSVKPKVAKPPAVISNSKAQCSSHAYDRSMFHSQRITKERKPTWSKKNVREYLMCPLTSEDKNKLTAQRRLKPSGKTVTKVGIWDIKDKSLARLVCPLDNNITPDKLYIDDTVIDAYFHLLKKRCDTYPNKYLKHHSFSCFIASKLFSGQAEDLSTWFDPKDLKDACKLFLPLCLPISNHWVLFCVDINNRQFLWLDSLENSRKSHESEMKVISEWFVERVLPHLDNKDARKWKSRVPEDIPSQENMVDCGVFVMKYADCLTHGDYFPFSQDDMPHFRRCIFLDIVEWSVHVPHRFISN